MKDNQMIYAAKVLKTPFVMMKPKYKENNETELRILKLINHPFAIKFIEDFNYEERQSIVIEYIAGGEL